MINQNHQRKSFCSLQILSQQISLTIVNLGKVAYVLAAIIHAMMILPRPPPLSLSLSLSLSNSVVSF
ncbi:hypothetical protein Patl1_19113 [Pistacia atlantica]|uniref:Uncharacterized protein n=1 Tax=Pistacia atlantica TaxID=434234 RepID=A0ACC1C0J1_9ROSI|nr:hypothetical protein Patl1_19113 [Pistacia atlantica]